MASIGLTYFRLNVVKQDVRGPVSENENYLPEVKL